MTDPLEALRSWNDRYGDDWGSNEYIDFNVMCQRIARFIADPASVEVVARAMRARRFERTGRVASVARMDAPSESELDDALAILTLIAERGMGD